MDTQTLVRASADVITIVTLRANDVYKRLQKDWTDKWTAVYGVVQSVNYNGEDAMLTALELSGDKVEIKVFGTEADLKLFSASVDEVKQAFADSEEAIRDAARRAHEESLKRAAALERFLEVKASVGSGRLAAAPTETKALES